MQVSSAAPTPRACACAAAAGRSWKQMRGDERISTASEDEAYDLDFMSDASNEEECPDEECYAFAVQVGTADDQSRERRRKKVR